MSSSSTNDDEELICDEDFEEKFIVEEEKLTPSDSVAEDVKDLKVPLDGSRSKEKIRSLERYEKVYEKFMKWKAGKNTDAFSEKVFLTYFKELAVDKSPSTLWCMYSMLKNTVRLKHNVNIGRYKNLTKFLEKKSDGFMPKKSKILTENDIKTFLKEAPDRHYLLDKVVLIFGVNGACRGRELISLTTSDLETHNDKMIVHLRTNDTNERMFIVQNELLKVVERYQKIRPAGLKTKRFFLSYNQGKCTKQVVGRHKIAAVPKRIASYLRLPNPESYTGNCFRRSSHTLLADSTPLAAFKRHSAWLADQVDAPDQKLSDFQNFQTQKPGRSYTILLDESKSKIHITTQRNEDVLKISPSPPTSDKPSNDLNIEGSTSSEESSSQTTQEIHLSGKDVQLTFSNCSNCNITFKID